MTKSKTIQEVTVNCMETHGKIKSFDEIAEIEEELLSKIEEVSPRIITQYEVGQPHLNFAPAEGF